MNLSHYNYDFDFPIVRKKRKLFFRILRVIVISSTILALISAFFISDNKNKTEAERLLSLLPIGLFLLSTFTLIFYSNLAKNFVILGNITITNNQIRINSQNIISEYQLSDIKNLTITFFAGEGDPYSNNRNSMIFKEGTGNYLEFEELSGTPNKYEFYVEKEGYLKRAILSMENRNIPFKLINKAFKRPTSLF